MHYFKVLVTVFSAVTAAHVITPIPSAVPTSAMYRRQEEDWAFSQVFAYYSATETSGFVQWGTLVRGLSTALRTSGEFWHMCTSTQYVTLEASVLTKTQCPLWTKCGDDGWLTAASTSSECPEEATSCFTELLYSTYPPDPTDSRLSWLWCGEGDGFGTSALPSTSAYYKEIPTTPVATGAFSTPPQPSSTESAPQRTSSDPEPAPKQKNNAGVIAGSVIGGIAILAISGFVIFFLWRRTKGRQDPGLVVESPDLSETLASDTAYHDTPELDPVATVKYAHKAEAPPAELPGDAGTAELEPNEVNAELKDTELRVEP